MMRVVIYFALWVGGICIGLLWGSITEHRCERAEREQLFTVIYYVAELADKSEKTKPDEALAIRKAIRAGLDRGGENAAPLPKVEQLLMRDMSKG
jgi:hypothetical protein